MKNTLATACATLLQLAAGTGHAQTAPKPAAQQITPAGSQPSAAGLPAPSRDSA